MPKVTINGVEHDFSPGMNVLEACRSVNVQVPHFCYHPLLKVVGSCRMCKVEVTQESRGRKSSRIDISCKVEIAEGMEIRTDTPEVKKQQQMTLEFLLANHPLDCPICDDAGECQLQNFYMEYGLHSSRMREPKVRKFKAADVGRSIMLDSERCVLCSRCVRFLSDVTHTYETGIFGMGSTERLNVVPGKRLDNDYAGNVVDLCPVGALTDKDFRFKRRVWYLKSADSICQGCARGCNVRIDYDDDPWHDHKRNFLMRTHRTEATAYQRIQRLKPRENPAVNQCWICDVGRYGYKDTDAADRVLSPMLRTSGALTEASAEAVVKEIAAGILASLKNNPGKIAVVASPVLTNEELFAAATLFQKKLNLPNVDHRLPIDPEWRGDDFLRSVDPYPNRLGCEWIGLNPATGGIGIADLDEAVGKGKIDCLICLEADPRNFLSGAALKKLKRRYLIVRRLLSGLVDYADAALPAAAWGEYRGTFVNYEGRVQKLNEAFPPLGEARPVWRWIVELASAMKNSLRWDDNVDLLRSLGEHYRQFTGLTFDSIGPQGWLVGENR